MKCSNLEAAKRVEKVFELRLGGAEFADIRQFAAAPEQAWDVSDRQLWRYIATADELVRKRFDARANYLLNRHLLQRRTLYAHALGAGDFGTALRILDSEAKLEALFESDELAELARQVGELHKEVEELRHARHNRGPAQTSGGQAEGHAGGGAPGGPAAAGPAA
jgi:hypothetical protein